VCNQLIHFKTWHIIAGAKRCGGEKILSPPRFQYCGGERPRCPRGSDAFAALSP